MPKNPAKYRDLTVEKTLKVLGKLLLGTVELVADELAPLNSVTPGTGAVSKALILDENGKIIMPADGQFEFSNATPAAAGANAAAATVLTAQVNLVTGADGA